jgi:hypothetical protein
MFELLKELNFKATWLNVISFFISDTLIIALIVIGYVLLSLNLDFNILIIFQITSWYFWFFWLAKIFPKNRIKYLKKNSSVIAY